MCQCVKECEPRDDELHVVKIPKDSEYWVKPLRDGSRLLVVKKPAVVKGAVDARP